MDDLTGKINQLLSDPQAMEQIMGLKSLLFDENEESSSKSPAREPEKKPEKAVENSILPAFSDDTAKTIMKLVPALSNMRQDNNTTRLLQALRPFLNKERQHKLDEASKILQIINILPVIKQLNL